MPGGRSDRRRRGVNGRPRRRTGPSGAGGGAPAPAGGPASPDVEERALPIARELSRVAAGDDPPAAKLEGALEIVFGAFGESGPDFAHLLIEGWARAAGDRHYRLMMAWLREQFRLSLEEILDQGMAAGAFRADLDSAAVASVILGTAEGCLLQSGSQGGTVPTERLVRAIMQLALPPPRAPRPLSGA